MSYTPQHVSQKMTLFYKGQRKKCDFYTFCGHDGGVPTEKERDR